MHSKRMRAALRCATVVSFVSLSACNGEMGAAPPPTTPPGTDGGGGAADSGPMPHLDVDGSTPTSGDGSVTADAGSSRADASVPVEGDIVGYGAGTVGGDDGELVIVRSLAELRTELRREGPKNLRLEGSGVWDLAGDNLDIETPNVTIDGSDADVVFKGASILIRTSQVILRHIRSRAGDETGNAQDVDAITLNGRRGHIEHIAIDHCEAIWGPDVSFVMLNDVTDVTVQYSILGEGLFRSAHPEATEDADGHALSANIAADDAGAVPSRVTFYGNLITTSQSRQPRIIGGIDIDLIDNVFYNYDEGPQGNPQGLNIIGNTYKWGPASNAAGLGDPTRLLWRYTPGGHGAFASVLDGTVYIEDAATVGFTAETPSGSDARVLADAPLTAPSVASIGSAAAYEMVLAQAGARLPSMDAETTRLIANVRDGEGVYYNGAGHPAPNPSW